MPRGLPTRSTICGRSMMTSRSPAARVLYGDRSPCTSPAWTSVGQRVAQLVVVALDDRALRADLGHPRGGLGLAVDGHGDPLHQDLGLVDLDRVGDRQAELPAAAQRVPLRDRPLAGRDLLAPGGLPLEGAVVARPLHRAALGVGRGAVERPVVGVAVALGRHHDGARRGGAGPRARARKTSASLPVLRTPSSVSMAPLDVTTQSGRGSGPFMRASRSSQRDQR